MKLVFEFTKTGNMKYISHLDLVRLFLRVLRMAGLRPAYSRGFNPHPDMSLALPLSLGLNSVCELLEFETEQASGPAYVEQAVKEVNERLPEGVRVFEWWEKPVNATKSLAANAAAATYEFMCEGIADAPALLADFFARESVIVQKTDKKTGADSEKDIRSEMLSYHIVKDMRGRMLAETTLLTSPGNTLNPVVFFKAFCAAARLDEEKLSPVITRTAILDKDGAPLKETLS